MKTVGVSMKPRYYVKKLDEFISGNKRLYCCGKRVNYDGGYIGLVGRVHTKAVVSFIFYFFIFHFHLLKSQNAKKDVKFVSQVLESYYKNSNPSIF